jgi:charged multivesicular body protein 4
MNYLFQVINYLFPSYQVPDTNTNNTIITLKTTLETLEKREEFLKKKSEIQALEAKSKLSLKDKNGALICLKRKKMFDAQITNLQQTKFNLETQINALESASMNLETIQALQSGSNAMKQIHKEISIGQVEDTIDEIHEQIDTSNEISNIITQPIGQQFDDNDLLDELKELDELENNNNNGKPTETIMIPQNILNLPEAPRHTPIICKNNKINLL